MVSADGSITESSLSVAPNLGSYSLINENRSSLIRVHQLPRAGVSLEEGEHISVTVPLVAFIQDDIRNRNRVQKSLRSLGICFEGRSNRLQSFSQVCPVRHRGGHDIVRLRLPLQPVQAIIKRFGSGVVIEQAIVDKLPLTRFGTYALKVISVHAEQSV